MRPYFEPVQELERIARGKPSPNISPELPKTTDGTTASIVLKQPRRVIQQVPTGVIDCKDYPEYAQIAGLVLSDRLLPLMKAMGNVLQKSWLMTTKVLTYGSGTSYKFFTNHNGVMYMDFVLPYVKDVLNERGKIYAPDSNIRFMRSWYQKRDIQAIIQKEKQLQEKNKKYQSEWDLKKLADWIEGGSTAKDAELQTPAERERGGDTGGFQMIHAFQAGKEAEFYSFSPQFQDGDVFRVKKNKDPRGNIPLNDMYCNIDGSNPLGRGIVEISGGVQNLIDQQMQMFQFLSTMLMGPPLQKWGNVNSSTLKFRPNAIWDMGTNPANKVEPYQVSNVAINNFPTNYGLLKSQILQLNSSNQGAAISSEIGNPQFSKTQAGVQAQQAELGVDDNYLRKQFEAWFGDMCETVINIFFAEMTGKGDLELNNDQTQRLSKTDAAKYIDKKTGKLTVPYGSINDVSFKFHVDASSSEVKEDNENVEKLTSVLELAMKVPDPSIQQAIPKIFKKIVEEIGIEDAEELFPDAAELAKQQAAGMQPQQPLTVATQPLPNQVPQEEPPLNPQEQQVVEALLEQNFTEEDAEQAIVMLRQDVPQEQIMQALSGKYAGAVR